MPAAEVIPLVEPAAPEPEREPEPDELPDFVVVPGSERTPGGNASSDGDATTLGFKPTAELVLEPSEARTQETESKPRGERRTVERRTGQERRKRSSHDPGDENDETGWMQGLSNRLSAYSLSEEDDAADDDPEKSAEGAS
jgi:hypothetical protein